MKKSDVWMKGGYPAINIKVYGDPRDEKLLPLELGQVAEHPGAPFRAVTTEPEFTYEWIDRHVSERDQNFWWDESCRDHFEQARTLAKEIFDAVDMWQEGRSGGWLVVQGLPDVRTWDAVMLGRWRKFETQVKVLVSDVTYGFLWLVHANVFEPWAEARDKAADDDAAALLPITVNAGD